MIWIILGVLLLAFGIYKLTAAYKQRTSSINNTSLAGIYEFEDFVNANVGTAYTAFTQGTGTTGQGAQISTALGQAYSTLVFLNTNANGDIAQIRAATGSFNAFRVLSGTVTTLACAVAFESTVHTDVVFTAGFASESNPLTASMAAYFMYDHSISNNWIAVRTISGSATQSITSVPVTADTFTRMKIIVTNDRAFFWLNAVLVATITTGGSSDQSLSPGFRMTQSVNASGRYVDIDYAQLTHQLAAPRPSP